MYRNDSKQGHFDPKVHIKVFNTYCLTCDWAFLDNFLRPDPIRVPVPIIAGTTVIISPVSFGDMVYIVPTHPIV